jgi:hypothetical protein
MKPSSFNLIKVLKETTVAEKEYAEQNIPTKPISLLNLGYECDTLLSFESSLVFYNHEEKKVILVFDGMDRGMSNLFFDNMFSLEHYDLIISYLRKRSKKTKKLFLEIKKKYIGYQKICLGYSLGGIMVNKYIDDDYIKGYIYSAPCNIDTKKNIVSYKLQTDISTYLFESYENKKNIIIKNNLLHIFKIFESRQAYGKYNHQLKAIDESEIPDIIF